MHLSDGNLTLDQCTRSQYNVVLILNVSTDTTIPTFEIIDPTPVSSPVVGEVQQKLHSIWIGNGVEAGM